MLKYLFLPVVLHFIWVPANAQQIFPEKFNNCITDQFAVESEIMTVSNKDSLLQAFIKNIPPKKLKDLVGTIYIQVLVDSAGMPCCLSIKNQAILSSKKLNLQEIVNTKTRWGIPKPREFLKKASAVIKLTFDEVQIKLERLGYNGKTGWTTLEETFITR